MLFDGAELAPLARRPDFRELASEVLDHTSRKGVGGVGGGGSVLLEGGSLFRDDLSESVKIATVIAKKGANTRDSLRRDDPV